MRCEALTHLQLCDATHSQVPKLTPRASKQSQCYLRSGGCQGAVLKDCVYGLVENAACSIQCPRLAKAVGTQPKFVWLRLLILHGPYRPLGSLVGGCSQEHVCAMRPWCVH